MMRLTLAIGFTFLVTFSQCQKADLEGSGDEFTLDDNEADDEYDDDIRENDIVPSRVVPNLQSPTFSHVGNQELSRATQVEPTRVPTLDPVYIEEEGSGGESDDNNKKNTPAFQITTSTTPRMPPMYTGPEKANRVIVTTPLSNSPPVLQKRLKKLPIVTGRTLRWRVPEDTFFDKEDGNTRKLRLSLRYFNGTLVRGDSWIRFNNRSQEIRLLPVDENDIGVWKFRLIARDSRGQIAEEILEVVVRQYSSSRLVNHEFVIDFTFTTWQPAVIRNWEFKILDRIRDFFGDPNLEQIVVKTIRTKPYAIGWTNSSLIQQGGCPRKDIEGLFQSMVNPKDSKSPSDEFKRVLGKNVLVKRVKLKFFGTCFESVASRSKNPYQSGLDNNVPYIRNPIDRINVTAGELLRFKVPEDTCYDKEDGSTSRLSLHLLTMNRKELSPKSWLNFDNRDQMFVGVPLEEEVGREEFQLVCSDRMGLTAVDGIEVIVLNRPFSERYVVEFAFHFDQDISNNRVEIVELLASFFEDFDPRNVVVKSLSEDKLVWFNKTMAYADCNDPRVNWMGNKLLSLSENEDGTRRQRASANLMRHFANFQLQDAYVVLRGSCAFTTPVPEVTQKNQNTIFHGIIPSSEYLMTFLIPAVIISCMLLLAILLACILHKKRKAGKLNLFYSETLPPRVPVILQDELYDENDPTMYQRQMELSEQPPEEVDRLIQGTRIVMQGDPIGGRPTPSYRKA